MKQLAFRVTILGGFGLALVILVSLSAVTYRGIYLALDNSRWVAHTQEVMAATEAALSLLKDAETGQRGYVITGSEQYLEPYQAALTELPQQLTRLRVLTTDNPSQQQYLATIEPLITQKFAELQETIHLRRTQGFVAAQAVVSTDQGKQRMDAIRTVMRGIEQEEQTLLQRRQAATEESATNTKRALVVGNVFAFVLVGFAGFTVNRDLRYRQQAERALKTLNTTLEQQVADRTAALQRAHEAERNQRKYFQTTLVSIGDAVIVTDPEGAVTFLNRMAEEVTGWTTADAAGKPLPEVFQIQHEETRQPVENPVTKVLREGGVVGLANHTLLIRRNEDVCSIDDSAAPIHDTQGKLLGIVLVFRDISERRQAEQILRDSEARYRTLFESIDEGFCVIEPVQNATGETVEFRYIEANPAFVAQSGGSNVVGKTIRQVFPSEPEEWIDTYATVLNTGEPKRFVRTLVTHGRVLDLYAFRIADGTQPRVAVLFKDITAHRQAIEASLRLAAIVESSDDAIISKSLDGIVTSWNAGAERIFGYRAEEMIGQSILRLLPEDRHDEERLILERLRRGEHVEHFETLRRTKDGRLLDMSVTISPLREGHGKIIGASKIARDITEQKRLEGELTQRAAELQRLNEELQQFAYIVSHDLKEPLRNIAQLVTFLAEDYQDQLDAQANTYITRTIAATQRLQQMLNDLLAYTQVGGRDFAFDSADCEALLTRVLEDLEVTIAEREATITHDPLPTVRGEATYLGQVFQNLIGNALKFYGKEPPRIHVSAQRDGTHWRFGVRDNGIGIDSRQATRLFQVFQRLHTRSEYPGSGIGLAICKKIVERHGGRIWVESTLGQGATFFFTLRDF